MTYVHQLMSKNVITLDYTNSAQDVAKVMSEKNIGTIIIVKDNEPIGIITERDLVKKICAKNLRSSEINVNDIISKPLITIQPNSPIELAATLMAENKIRRLPVVKDGKLIGIITSADIIKDLEGWIESP